MLDSSVVCLSEFSHPCLLPCFSPEHFHTEIYDFSCKERCSKKQQRTLWGHLKERERKRVNRQGCWQQYFCHRYSDANAEDESFCSRTLTETHGSAFRATEQHKARTAHQKKSKKNPHHILIYVLENPTPKLVSQVTRSQMHDLKS